VHTRTFRTCCLFISPFSLGLRSRNLIKLVLFKSDSGPIHPGLQLGIQHQRLVESCDSGHCARCPSLYCGNTGGHAATFATKTTQQEYQSNGTVQNQREAIHRYRDLQSHSRRRPLEGWVCVPTNEAELPAGTALATAKCQKQQALATIAYDHHKLLSFAGRRFVASRYV
jgi:hypothetical protein